MDLYCELVLSVKSRIPQYCGIMRDVHIRGYFFRNLRRRCSDMRR